MKNTEMLAVHDDDLIQLLKALKKYDDVVSGNNRCIFCQKTINISNIGSIIPICDKIEFSCNDDNCLNFLSKIGGKYDA